MISKGYPIKGIRKNPMGQILKIASKRVSVFLYLEGIIKEPLNRDRAYILNGMAQQWKNKGRL